MTKSKRDITLGEIQTECARRASRCLLDKECEYHGLCKSMHDQSGYLKSPDAWNLTDAPRFTDSQKMFLRGWMAIGAVEAHKCTIEGEGDPFDVIDFYDADGCCIATVSRIDWLNNQVEFGVDMELFDAIGDVPCAK